MALVPLVHVDDHGRQPFEGAGARERAGVERASGGESRGELERRCLCIGVVAADERILVGRMVRTEARRCERVEARDDRCVHLGLDSLGERDGFRRGKDATLGEAELGRNREHWRRADGLSQLTGGVERSLGVDGEDDEIGVGARLGVRRPRAVEPERRRLCARCVT